ncbi:MAG: glycosyl hydrolase family 18 protein [Phycisphaerales bacterium]|nr:glycosyl hydrolase family 18 protein [Phycisphaerales bacterium]
MQIGRAQIEELEARQMLAHVELVRNGAFEAGPTADWVRVGNWIIGGGSHAHGGSQYAYLTNSSGSPANNLSGTLYQQLTIPVTSVNPTLTFWTKITTAETTTTQQKDLLHVRILDASGSQTLAHLITLSNLNAVTTAGPHTAAGRYTPHSFALPPALIGQTIRVAFVGSTDASNPTVFRVDDVGLSEPIPQTPGTRGQVVGYLPYYRQSLFSQMDLDHLTHINYFAITASASGALTTTNINNASLAAVVNAAHARGIGVSITVGPQSFSALAADPAARAAFAQNIRNYLLARNLDGVDIDWEPPGNGVDSVNYGLLIHDLYAQLNPIGKKITAAVNPWTKEIPVAATQMMDWLNVMCYDFHYADHSTFAAATDGMNQWFHYGVARDKLVMGIPFYGRSGTSWSNTTARTYGAIVNDYRSIHGVYPTAGIDSYTDSSGATFFFNGRSTVQAKVDFVRDNAFAGAMIWELGQDHWENGQYTPYSLLPVVGSIRRPDPPSAPALAAGNDTGTSSTDRITRIANPTFTGTAMPEATVTLLINGLPRGSGTTDSSGFWSAGVSIPLPDGGHTVTAVASTINGTSLPSTATTVTIDTVAPTVLSLEFEYLTRQAVRFDFSETVHPTFTIDDLTVSHVATSLPVPAGQMSLQRSGNVYHLGFNGVPGGILPDGNYRLSIQTGSVTDVAGNALSGTPALDFFVLAGDANRDRSVNISDFSILAARFNLPGTFSQGDFNYNGTTELGDFSILAARFNTSLPAPGDLPAPRPAGNGSGVASSPAAALPPQVRSWAGLPPSGSLGPSPGPSFGGLPITEEVRAWGHLLGPSNRPTGATTVQASPDVLTTIVRRIEDWPADRALASETFAEGDSAVL